MSDDIRKLVAKVTASKPEPKVTRAKHTLALREPEFREFAELCRSRGLTVSEVMDDLIRIFLKEARGG